jgi:membrane fusion protein (multidrug efflux system)
VAHRREIVVRNELDGVFVIASGVGAEDKIVVEGVQQVQDGEKIEYEFHPLGQFPGHQKSLPE